MILPSSFYNKPTLKVARDLLGCFLIRELPIESPLLTKERARVRYKIVETEAYNGLADLASHASRGKTERNKIMFGRPGLIYVYFTYGMHYLLNIVTEDENYPAAVLIRAVEPNYPPDKGPLRRSASEARGKGGFNGPARLTRTLKIDKRFNGLPIYTKKHGLWIEGRVEQIKPRQIVRTKRIGVDYAKHYKDKKWRFYLKSNSFVSKP